jgi:metallothiol transferase
MIRTIESLLERFERGALSRREFVASVVATAAAGARAQEAGTPPAPPARKPIPATGIDHAALRVSDVARSRDFYRDLLGMRVTRDGAQSAFLSMGEPFLALFKAGTGHSKETDPGLDHLSFSVEGWDFEALVADLRARGLEPWTQERRIYFRDPDGIILQLSA